jgi:GNAT superfamily N-acetyltransferase
MWVEIRLAVLEDAVRLPEIEQSASNSFFEIPDLASLPYEENLSVRAHQGYIALGTEWVALNEGGELVGFLAAEIISTELHLWELAVRQDVQGRGIGGRLVRMAEIFAKERRLDAMTLTTFTDVPWNAPWYSRLGFEGDSADARLATIVRAELERGLPRRCAMRKRLGTVAPSVNHQNTDPIR